MENRRQPFVTQADVKSKAGNNTDKNRLGKLTKRAGDRLKYTQGWGKTDKGQVKLTGESKMQESTKKGIKTHDDEPYKMATFWPVAMTVREQH